MVATFPNYDFDRAPSNCDSGGLTEVEDVQCSWFRIHQLLQEPGESKTTHVDIEAALLQFSETVQSIMSNTSSNYNVGRMYFGLLAIGLAALLCLPATYKLLSKYRHAGTFLAVSIFSYGGMMFASSYVEEEQQFWYWIITAWTFYLHVRWSARQMVPRVIVARSWQGDRSMASVIRAAAPIGLVICNRILRRWNQTGQKFAAESDIARTFFQPHQNILWALVVLTYADTCLHLIRSMSVSVIWLFSAVTTTVIAFIFKLNFVASDSPELLGGSFLGPVGNGRVSLVVQARLAFCGIAWLVLYSIIMRRGTQTRFDAQKGKFRVFQVPMTDYSDSAHSVKYCLA